MKNQTSRYDILFTKKPNYLNEAQKFRQKIFRKSEKGLDEDEFDNNCVHCLVFDKANSDKLVLVFRIINFSSMAEIVNSYSAQFYDLKDICNFSYNPMELGRFCVDPFSKDPFLVLTAMKFLFSYIKENNKNFLFGCSSFEGCDASDHLRSLIYLKANFVTKGDFAIKRKAKEVITFSSLETKEDFKLNDYKKTLPSLLKFYLRLGGKVSDHAVIDRDLNTMHVFTYVRL
mgnify:FL=1